MLAYNFCAKIYPHGSSTTGFRHEASHEVAPTRPATIAVGSVEFLARSKQKTGCTLPSQSCPSSFLEADIISSPPPCVLPSQFTKNSCPLVRRFARPETNNNILATRNALSRRGETRCAVFVTIVRRAAVRPRFAQVCAGFGQNIGSAAGVACCICIRHHGIGKKARGNM